MKSSCLQNREGSFFFQQKTTLIFLSNYLENDLYDSCADIID